jgi:hypothetical protein
MNLKENMQSRVLHLLREQLANNELDDATRLSRTFPDGLHPSSNMTLDIVVSNAEGIFC